MSFPVALRSAIFYIVACTPCAKARHRQKTKENAKKERLEKEKLESEQPGLYRHPSPFNTNPYWQEEIKMGPSLPKKAASKNSSQKALGNPGRDVSGPPSVSEQRPVEDSRINITDSTTTIPPDEKLSDDWNRRHGYQREDEELWGQWSGHKLMDAFSKARDSAGRLFESTLGIEKGVTEEARRDFYFTPRNPPVNDYHPPVVSSKAPNSLAHKWMLQPPPSAKVMEGKIPVGRAASSGSKESSKTLIGDEASLGRSVPEKLKDKRSRATSPTEDELINSLFVARSNRSITFPRSRSLSLDGYSIEESDDSPTSPVDRRKPRARPVIVPPGIESDEESDDDEPMPSPRPSPRLHPTISGHAAQRPKLETIRSSGSVNSGRFLKKPMRARSDRIHTLSGAASPVGDDSD